MQFALLTSVFVIATCGLVYELIAGALASYVLGDSITQFSTIIGTYLFAMGIGSYLSKFIKRNPIATFIEVELLVGLVGGCSAAILFVAFQYVTSFRLLLYGLVGITGILVGAEIPLLMRALSRQLELKELVSRVLTFDYIGALLASLLFPLVLVPHLGLIRSGFLFGMVNTATALWTLYLFSKELPWSRLWRSVAWVEFLALGVGFAYSERIMTFAEVATYADTVVFAQTTPYQRIVLTKNRNDTRLFLNGNLQFSSRDEYRYHEALVHVGMAALPAPKHVLVLGGGDGLAAREILKYPTVEAITLVDLDQKMTQLFMSHPALVALNENSLQSVKVRVINRDAFVWLRANTEFFDFIAVDFPDPSNYSIGKLYTSAFYRSLQAALADKGIAVIQSTSPYVAKKTFWCIERTLADVGLFTAPFHAYVPSFGEWGFVIATKHPFTPPTDFPRGLRFIDQPTVASMFVFPEDMRSSGTRVNRLNDQVLVRYFEDEWSEYLQ